MCEHDLAEKETACADGMCPICLASRLRRLESELAKWLKYLGKSED